MEAERRRLQSLPDRLNILKALGAQTLGRCLVEISAIEIFNDFKF